MSAGPVRSVLEAVDAGARSHLELVQRTGLRGDVVAAVVDHLARSGRIELTVLRTGCPSSACGSCVIGCSNGD